MNHSRGGMFNFEIVKLLQTLLSRLWSSGVEFQVLGYKVSGCSRFLVLKVFFRVKSLGYRKKVPEGTSGPPKKYY